MTDITEVLRGSLEEAFILDEWSTIAYFSGHLMFPRVTLNGLPGWCIGGDKDGPVVLTEDRNIYRRALSLKEVSC